MANPSKNAPPGGWTRTRRPRPTRTFDTGGDLRPLLERYSLNLLVATRLGSARDDEGKPVAASNRWLRSSLAAWAKKHGRGSSTFDEDLEALLQTSKGRPVLAGRAPGRLGRNVATLGTSFDLERAERAVLQFKVALLTVPGFDSVVDLVGPVTSGGAADLLAAATGESAARVGEALERKSGLIDAGLLFVAPGTLAHRAEDRHPPPAHRPPHRPAPHATPLRRRLAAARGATVADARRLCPPWPNRGAAEVAPQGSARSR